MPQTVSLQERKSVNVREYVEATKAGITAHRKITGQAARPIISNKRPLIVTLMFLESASHIFPRGVWVRVFHGSTVEQGPTRHTLRMLDELRSGPIEEACLANLPLSFTRFESWHVRIGRVDGR
jgi:hypothetical protein